MNGYQRFSIAARIGLLLLFLPSCSLHQDITSIFSPQKTSTPTAAPTVESRPETARLQVKDIWMGRSGDDPRELIYAVNLYNPDKNYRLEKVAIQITLYDVNGSVLDRWEEGLLMMWPDSIVPIVDSYRLPEGSKAQRIEVTVTNPGRPIIAESRGYPFTAAKVSYTAEASDPVVTGVITSAYDQDVYHTRFAAVAYETNGAISGANFSSGYYLPAGGAVAVKVPLKLSSPPARVALYFIPDLNSLTNLPVTSSLEVERVDMIRGAGGLSSGIAFVLKNLDTKTPAVRAFYFATIYDEAGTALASCMDSINGVIFPGSRLGSGCSLKMPENRNVVRANVQTLVDSSQSLAKGVTENPLIASQVTFSDSEASAVIKSLWGSELKDVSVRAIGYDAQGAIVAYGADTLAKLPAAGEAQVRVRYIQVGGKPVKCEVFAAPDQSSFGD